jgi:hypothetical protein
MNEINEQFILGLAYLVFVIFLLLYLLSNIFKNITIENIYKLIGKSIYIYGHVGTIPARKNTLTGEVQFVLWRAGQQGHKEDYWHRFDSSWWSQFKPNIK